MGLYPQKGVIGIGSDADLVIYNEEEYTISQKNRHSAVDYTSYEGFKVNFKVDTVIVRGEIVIGNGEIKVPNGYGKFIERHF